MKKYVIFIWEGYALRVTILPILDLNTTADNWYKMTIYVTAKSMYKKIKENKYQFCTLDVFVLLNKILLTCYKRIETQNLREQMLTCKWKMI